MHSYDRTKFFSFHADATALGGFIEAPFDKPVPTVAPVSLPAVGGYATARSGAFNFEDIVRCAGAYTRVSGRENPQTGAISVLVTAVVEGLNILEVVTAERVVAQVSVTIPGENRPSRISLAGSGFEGLRLAGCDTRLDMNSRLLHPDVRPDFRQAGLEQADRLIRWYKEKGDPGAYDWALKRHGWMSTAQPPSAGGGSLCSLVDGCSPVDGGAGPVAGRTRGHIVDIPGFGRIVLGELRITGETYQLLGIRAELGCPIAGQIGVSCVGGTGGVH